jgi:hypothetical protein
MNRTLPPARYRLKPETAFLENLIDPIDRLTEPLFSILTLMTFTMTSWIISRSTGSEHTLTSVNIIDLAIAVLVTIVAYGVIDWVIYALLTKFGRGESHHLLQGIHLPIATSKRFAKSARSISIFHEWSSHD